MELSSRARASQRTHPARLWLDAVAGPSRRTCFLLTLCLRILLSFTLLLCAGCKKKESPPPVPREKSAIISTQDAPGSPFMMSLVMDPAQPRFGRKTNFRVTLKETPGKALEGGRVEASLVMPLMDMGKNQFTLNPAGNGEYQGTGEFNMAGEWEVVVTASAHGKTGKTTFNVNVAE